MLRRATGECAVASVASLARPATAESTTLTPEETFRLASILERRGFVGRDVVLAAAPNQVTQALLELPPITNNAIPLHSLARNELCASQRLDPATVEVAHWEVPTPARGGRATYVMAAAHKTSDVEATVNTFDAAGLDVIAMDLNVWALARGCSAASANAHGAVIPILDLGWGAATLVMLLRDTVVFHRTVDEAGLATLAAAASQATRLGGELMAGLLDHAAITLAQPTATIEPDRRDPGLSADLLAQLQDAVRTHCGQLAEEVRASIAYVTQRYAEPAPAQVLLVGGGAAIPGVAEALRSTLSIGCRAAAPTNCPPAATLAAGLAMYPNAAAMRAAA
jgi:Tfp pilus assembly PilM family ATPase